MPPPLLRLLQGKTAVVTGASRGIGYAIAERFAREGARCVLVGRNEDGLRKAREKLVGVGNAAGGGGAADSWNGRIGGEGEGDGGSGHEIKVGDVGKEEFWREWKSEEKKVDILVNAAGIAHFSPLFSTTSELLEEVMQTNLHGTIWACKVVGRGMMGRGEKGGCIINVASLLGLKRGRGSVAYAASKAGVIGLTRALAAEIGPSGIRVNVIVPGFIETDMTAAMTPEARSEALNAIPLKRFGEATEIADAALFLATNKYANNCVLNLDGGLSAT